MSFLKRRTTELAEPPAVADEVESSSEATSVTPVTERRPIPRPALERTRQSRVPVMLATLFAVVLVAATVLGTWLASRDDGASEEPAAVVTAGQRSSALLLVEDAEGRAVSLVLLLDDGADTRSLFVMPPSLSIQLPGYGDGLLADASVIGGANLAELALVNELGIAIDQHCGSASVQEQVDSVFWRYGWSWNW